MAQDTVFGKANVSAMLKVAKADGTFRYYMVVDEQNIEISAEQYSSEGGL